VRTYGGFLHAVGPCVLCRQKAVPILIRPDQTMDPEFCFGICEPCARIADWRFRSMADLELAGAPFPTMPGAALVLITRDRIVDGHPDTVSPFDVLMVERKDEPGKFGLPGGKLEQEESSVEAAVRELAEETGIVTWESALIPIYSGFSARGRLVDTYICRAYAGKVTLMAFEGVPEWKPWPPSNHVGVLKGYYRGLEMNFELRRRLYKEARAESPPPCQHLSKPALNYVLEVMGPDYATVEGKKNASAFHANMSEEEKQAAAFVLREILVPKPSTSLVPRVEKEPEDTDDSDDADKGPDFSDEGREGPG